MGNLKIIAVSLMFILVSCPFFATQQTPQEGKAAIKAQLDKIPVGNTIDVQLLKEGSVKIKGKLMSAGSDCFEIQTLQSAKDWNQKILFADVKSVKKNGMRRSYKALPLNRSVPEAHPESQLLQRRVAVKCPVVVPRGESRQTAGCS